MNKSLIEAARAMAREIIRHRIIILEMEKAEPVGEYNGEPTYDMAALVGAEVLAMEQLCGVIQPKLAAFHASQTLATIEQCCKAVCKRCANNEAVEPFSGSWIHVYLARGESRFEQCDAASIRALGAAAPEQKEKV